MKKLIITACFLSAAASCKGASLEDEQKHKKIVRNFENLEKKYGIQTPQPAKRATRVRGRQGTQAQFNDVRTALNTLLSLPFSIDNKKAIEEQIKNLQKLNPARWPGPESYTNLLRAKEIAEAPTVSAAAAVGAGAGAGAGAGPSVEVSWAYKELWEQINQALLDNKANPYAQWSPQAKARIDDLGSQIAQDSAVYQFLSAYYDRYDQLNQDERGRMVNAFKPRGEQLFGSIPLTDTQKSELSKLISAWFPKRSPLRVRERVDEILASRLQ